MTLLSKSIALIGAGNMGEAMLRGLVKGQVTAPDGIRATDLDGEKVARLSRELGTGRAASAAEAGLADIVVLAVKPQQASAVLSELAQVMRPGQLLISIAAGLSTQKLEQGLGKEIAVVRVMPNTPALISQGASAFCLGRHADQGHAALAEAVLRPLGVVVQVAEQDMDAVTALSGSGPAYVFLLAEAMLEAAQAMGLAQETAQLLVKQTMRGAGELLQTSAAGPAQLRRQVTSPKGTTEAAIGVFEAGGFNSLVGRALKAAQARSRELGQ